MACERERKAGPVYLGCREAGITCSRSIFAQPRSARTVSPDRRPIHEREPSCRAF